MKILKSQAGFTAVHALLFLVIIGIIGFTGWKVYRAGKTANITDSSTPTSVAKKGQPNPATSTIPEGFVEYQNKELGFKFAYPKDWKIKEIKATSGEGLPTIELTSNDFQEDEAALAYGGTKTGAIYTIYAYKTDKKTFDEIPEGTPGTRRDLKNVVVDSVPALDYYQAYEGPPAQSLEFIHNGLHVGLIYRYKEQPGSKYDQKYLDIRKQIIGTIKFL